MEAVTPSSAARTGLSRSGLYRAAVAGEYVRVARGIYVPHGLTADSDWVEAATRRPDATVCLASALAHHGLTDAIPRALDVAIPRGERLPARTGAIAWHSYDKATFEVGRSVETIPGSELRIGMYSAERTIVDAFRLRGSLGYETARDALKEWLRLGGKPAQLLAIAEQIPRSRGPLALALEVLT